MDVICERCYTMPPNMIKLSLQVPCGYKGQFTTIFIRQQKVVVVKPSNVALDS